MSCPNCSSITLPSGNDGNNAYTITTASFIQPAVATNVTVSVSNANQYIGIWAIRDQIIYIEDAGYFQVVSSTATQIIVNYTSDYTTYNQSLTTAGGTVASGRKVSPAGQKGIAGSNGTNAVTILNAYQDLTGTGNDAPTGDSTLFTYTTPASALATNGDYFDIDIYYDYNDNDRCIVKIGFGGSTIITYNEQDADATRNVINIQISRISNTSQLWVFNKQTVNSTMGYHNSRIIQTSSAATLSNTNVFNIVVDNTTLGANQIILKKCVIKKVII